MNLQLIDSTRSLPPWVSECSKKKWATTTVGHRSLLTDLVVLSLAAALGWPDPGFGGLSIPPAPTSAGATPMVVGAGIRDRSHPFKPLAKRDPSTSRGVLDDDPAILIDNAEEWIEGSTCPVLPAMEDFTADRFPVAMRLVIMIDDFAPAQPALIDWLHCYQC